MPKDSHQRAAEFHDLAAHAHRTAAAHHEKQDHLTAHEHSRQAAHSFAWPARIFPQPIGSGIPAAEPLRDCSKPSN